MPQISPMNWLLAFILFISIFIIMMIILYWDNNYKFPTLWKINLFKMLNCQFKMVTIIIFLVNN